MTASGSKILVVDDEFDILVVVRKSLEKWGLRVDAFTNPLYALQRFRDNPSAYSVVLVDIQMPEMNGIALASIMKKIKPDLKVIIMSAFDIMPDDLSISLSAISRGDILRKPFTMTKVCQTVKKHLPS